MSHHLRLETDVINLHRRAAMQKMRNRRAMIASRCGFCHRYASEDDRIAAQYGAKVVHGICEACAEHFPDPAA